DATRRTTNCFLPRRPPPPTTNTSRAPILFRLKSSVHGPSSRESRPFSRSRRRRKRLCIWRRRRSRRPPPPSEPRRRRRVTGTSAPSSPRRLRELVRFDERVRYYVAICGGTSTVSQFNSDEG
ncbi:hypothetical protein ZEAMMB73_Zm00001d010061, partial [Zea mays]